MIFVTSYPYVYERHIRIFDFFKEQNDLVFILPKQWKSKEGRIIDRPVQKPYGKLIAINAYFWHSRYPLLHGQLKGWMPKTGSILRSMAKPGDILLTSIEPNMLVTYLNARIARSLDLKHVFITWQNIPYSTRMSGLKLRITEYLIRKNVRLSAGVMCGTKLAHEILKPYLVPNLKAAVIPQSGVDMDMFKPDVLSDFRSRYNLDGKIIFLFGAVFDERKGVMTTIDAFNKALLKIPNAHLVMIGIGKLWKAAQVHVRELELIDHVTFIPWMNNKELPSVFAAVDVLVHPSEPYRDWEEQYGWTMLQASSSGLPVIATKIGSIHEAVLDGKTGMLVGPKDVEALRDAMVKLALNPQLRKDMGTAGRAYIQEHFSHQSVASRMEQFLRAL